MIGSGRFNGARGLQNIRNIGKILLWYMVPARPCCASSSGGLPAPAHRARFKSQTRAPRCACRSSAQSQNRRNRREGQSTEFQRSEHRSRQRTNRMRMTGKANHTHTTHDNRRSRYSRQGRRSHGTRNAGRLVRRPTSRPAKRGKTPNRAPSDR